MVTFYLWLFHPIPCHGLPLRGFTITVRHTTLRRPRQDERPAGRRNL